MQIYRHMDIGTAKPSLKEQEGIKHHIIDIINPDEEFSAADFQAKAKQCIENIYQHNKIPLLTGGTGFYINSVCYNYTFSEAKKDENLRTYLRSQAEMFGKDYLHEKLKKKDPISAKNSSKQLASSG